MPVPNVSGVLYRVFSQLEEFEVAARCCFTFLHRNPDDELASSSVSFYRNKLDLKDDEFIYREPDIITHQESYLKGAYTYLGSLFLPARHNCQLQLSAWPAYIENTLGSYRTFERLSSLNLSGPPI